MVSFGVKERILAIRLLEKLAADPAYAAALGVEGELVQTVHHRA